MILRYRHAYTGECLHTRRADAAPAVGTVVLLAHARGAGEPERYQVVGLTEHLLHRTAEYYGLTDEAGPDVDVILEEVR